MSQRHLFRDALCVKSPLCYTGFDSAKQFVITLNIPTECSEVSDTGVHTLFTFFAELGVILILRGDMKLIASIESIANNVKSKVKRK